MAQPIESITILGGKDKSGRAEAAEIVLKPGDIVSVVGPTGSGKSRLLADIEYVAQKDTPSGRQILINGEAPDASLRFAWGQKLVAQLSQNMNFVMDIAVGEFIRMHAECREISDMETCVRQVLHQTNLLAGEPVSEETPLTALSGGQSRALMISDTALLCASPIVLIDEIENAGIDRQKALAVLVQQQKIVLMATHDPILALIGHFRLVIQNGGIHKVLHTSDKERDVLAKLQKMDLIMSDFRRLLRAGESLDETLAVIDSL